MFKPIIFFRNIFFPLLFKNSYLTPITDMASSFKFWDATPSPSLDWEIVICGSKFNKCCSKFLRQYIKNLLSDPNSVLKILYLAFG